MKNYLIAITLISLLSLLAVFYLKLQEKNEYIENINLELSLARYDFDICSQVQTKLKNLLDDQSSRMTECYSLATNLTNEIDDKSYRIYELEKNEHDVMSSIPSFQYLAENLANSHDYSTSYNCVNFSRDLNQKLLSEGWQSKTVWGFYNTGNKTGHVWVLVTVPIEATSGKIISPEEYANYELVDDYN